MKREILSGLLGAWVFLGLAPAVSAEIPPPPAPVGPSMPEVERFRLSNGLSVLLIPSHANPYVEARFVARAGTAVDPAGKEGLTTFAAAMVTHGTLRHDEAQIADLIESMGATITGQASLDTFEVAGSVVTLDPDHLVVFLDLYTDVVRRAVFPEASFARTRELRLSSLRSLGDRPALMADRGLHALLYRTGPRGRPPGGTLDSLPNIERGDLLAFRERVLIPQHSVLAFAGDFDPAAMRAWIEDAFGDPGWGAQVCQPSDRPGFCERLCVGAMCYSNPMASASYGDPEIARAAFQGIDVLVIDTGDSTATQTHWRLGQDNPVTLLDPRWAAFRLGTQILGGDFTSRLNQVLRVEEGLTYGAHLDVSFGVNDSGALSVTTQVAPRDLRRSVDLALRELDTIVRIPMSMGEVENVRRKIVNAFPFKFETITHTLKQLLALEVAGVAPSWLENYKATLREPSVSQVHEAMALLLPHKMALVAVGPAELASSLGAYGRVRVVSVESFLRSGLTYAVPAKAKAKAKRSRDRKGRKRHKRRRRRR